MHKKNFKLYNALSKKKETFHSLYADKIKIYTCGITVYDHCHLGHARTQMAIDVIVRYLTNLGWDVTWIRNITDIDDKIILAAQQQNVAFNDLTHEMTHAMHEVFQRLNILNPSYEPKATDYINDMVQMIQILIDKGYAYIEDNDVYFAVHKYSSYGQLSHQLINQVKHHKTDKLDFVLWKHAKPLEPSFKSPFGDGRPGWHIECSAMSFSLLGKQFDIHMGGRDLLFPHHENEIAQSDICNNCIPANYWMHVGLLHIKDRKMSKSLQNYIQIREILLEHSPNTLRFFFLRSHYRSDCNFSFEELTISAKTLDNLLKGLTITNEKHETEFNSLISAQFHEVMSEDFNTPRVLAILSEWKTIFNKEKDEVFKMKISASIVYTLNLLGFSF